MEDTELLDHLWTRFAELANPNGLRLAQAVRDFENGEAVSYHCLALAIGTALMSVCKQPGAAAFAKDIGYQLLGLVEPPEGVCCLAESAKDVYASWWALRSFAEDRDQAGVLADLEEARDIAKNLLAA